MLVATQLIGLMANQNAGPFAVTEYTGSGATQDIVNQQNLAAGALTLIDRYDSAAVESILVDTARGGTKYLRTPDEGQEITFGSGKDCVFLSNGLRVKSNGDGYTNTSGGSYALFSWLKQAGYLDIVTYTGNYPTGVSPYNRNIPHLLGVPPSLMLCKNLSSSGEYYAYHSALGNTVAVVIPTRAAPNPQPATGSFFWGNTSPTSTNFTVGSSNNVSGDNHVAYLFGESGGNSKFGAYTGTGANPGPNLIAGLYPAAWFIKRTDAVSDWLIFWRSGASIKSIKLNASDAVTDATSLFSIASGSITVTSTSSAVNALGGTYIWGAWR